MKRSLPEQLTFTATLVYLADYLLQNGETISQVFSAVAILNGESGTRVRSVQRGGSSQRSDLYDCSDEDVARAKSRLGLRALVPFLTPITAERFAHVPRVFIECLRDRVISPASQKKMYTPLPCQTILSMQTSHASFFSALGELARHRTSLESVSS